MQYRIRKTEKKGKFSVNLPASKSVNNRLLILSALSNGKVVLNNLSQSDDSQIMFKLLNSKESTKNTGHAGTVMRFLTAFYSIQSGEILLTGSERMKNRPITELVNALKKIGAKIEYTEKEGFPPLKINGRKLDGGKIKIDSGISSQYISALMMIGSLLEKGLEIELIGNTISLSYIDLTIGLLQKVGIDASRQNKIIQIKKSTFKEIKMDVESDWSSASYWYSLVGLSDGIEIVLPGLIEESMQGDVEIRNIFSKLGVATSISAEGIVLTKIKQKENFLEYDFRNIPDMVQSFIPYCIAKNIRFQFSGCRTLRIKETDRILALSNEFKKFGVNLKYSEDGEHISWNGKSKADWSKSVVIDTYDDHRMALGLAPLCIMAKGLSINHPDVVSKSYPSYWDDLREIGFLIKEF